MTKSKTAKILKLKLNARNLLTYIIHFKERYPNSPCFIPRCPNKNLASHLRAVEILEKHKLIRVSRESNPYTNWVATALITRENFQWLTKLTTQFVFYLLQSRLQWLGSVTELNLTIMNVQHDTVKYTLKTFGIVKNDSRSSHRGITTGSNSSAHDSRHYWVSNWFAWGFIWRLGATAPICSRNALFLCRKHLLTKTEN